METTWVRLQEFVGNGVYRFALADERLLSCNQAFLSILDLHEAPDTVLGKSMSALVIHLDPPDPIYQAVFEAEELRKFRHHIRTLTGLDRWIEHDCVVNTDGKTGECVVDGLLRDITEEVHAEQALRARNDEEQHFSAALRELHNIRNVLVSEQDIHNFCRQAVILGHEVLGFDRLSLWFVSDLPTEIVGSYGIDEYGRLRDEREERISCTPGSMVATVLADQARIQVREDEPLRNAQAEIVGHGAHAVAALWDGNTVTGVLSVDNLISQQAFTRHRTELLEIFADTLGHLYSRLRLQISLRALAQELIVTEERERRQLAQALHDTVSQTLVLTNMRLSSLRANTAFHGELDDTIALLDQIIDHTRTLTFELSPPILYELGLDAALEWLAESLEARYQLRIRVQCVAWRETLGDDLRAFLFTAIREVLLNVIKHAQAHRVTVKLRKDVASIVAVVSDDGIGFVPTLLPNLRSDNSGFGLFSIRERLRHLGGHLDILSSPDHGTRVTLVVPVV